MDSTANFETTSQAALAIRRFLAVPGATNQHLHLDSLEKLVSGQHGWHVVRRLLDDDLHAWDASLRPAVLSAVASLSARPSLRQAMVDHGTVVWVGRFIDELLLTTTGVDQQLLVDVAHTMRNLCRLKSPALLSLSSTIIPRVLALMTHTHGEVRVSGVTALADVVRHVVSSHSKKGLFTVITLKCVHPTALPPHL
jgi:hypothetical protein